MLKSLLQKEQIDALKSHNQEKLDFIRYILAQIINDEIDKKANLKIRSHFDCMLKDMAIILTYIINNFKNNK